MEHEDCELCRAGWPAISAEFLDGLIAYGVPLGKARHHAEIVAHLERFAGCPPIPYMQLRPDRPTPLDVLVAAPTPSRDFYVLLTAGMSDLPMRPPPETGMDDCFAELAICLPGRWRLDEASIRQRRWNWPLEMLAELASYPHEEQAWIWYRHTLDYQCPYEGSGDFRGVLFDHDAGLPSAFGSIPVGDGKEVRILAIVPLFPEEIGFGLSAGPDLLRRTLVRGGVGPVLNPGRAPVVS